MGECRRFNEHMDETDDPLVFQHACKMELEAAQLALPLGTIAGLAQKQEPDRPGGEAGGR